MTEISRPWNGITIGDAGPYSSADWSQLWQQLFLAYADNAGVIPGIDDDLAVVATSPDSNQVSVSAGAAIVRGRWYYNDTDELVSIAANASGSTRFDIVYLERHVTNQEVRLGLIQGTPGSGLPSLTQNAIVWQIPLAYVTVANGFATIAQADITDLREWATVPSFVAVPVTNVSASVLESGAVGVWSGTAESITTSTALGGGGAIAGIVERRMLATSGTGRVVIAGVYPIIVDAAVAVGDLLTHSTTAGRAIAMTSTQRAVYRPFARALTAQSTVGQRCLAYIQVPAEQRGGIRMATGTYTGNNAATQAVTGIPFGPRLLQVWSQVNGDTNNIIGYKSDQDGTRTFYSNAYQNDQIISLDAGGFTVGDGTGAAAGNVFNVNARVYTYIALG